MSNLTEAATAVSIAATFSPVGGHADAALLAASLAGTRAHPHSPGASPVSEEDHEDSRSGRHRAPRTAAPLKWNRSTGA